MTAPPHRPHNRPNPELRQSRCLCAGLKGFRRGSAEVSSRHANYIVNLGSATSADVEAVIDAVRERVRSEFQVTLELEVKLIG